MISKTNIIPTLWPHIYYIYRYLQWFLTLPPLIYISLGTTHELPKANFPSSSTKKLTIGVKAGLQRMAGFLYRPEDSGKIKEKCTDTEREASWSAKMTCSCLVL